MKDLIKQLLGSKKAWATLTAMVVYLVGRFGFDVAYDDLWPVMMALCVFVAGQGMADIGKHAPKPELPKTE